MRGLLDKWILCACLLLALVSDPLQAQNRLYTGQGALEAENPDLDAALLEALDEVLLRLSGQPDVLIREQLGMGLVEARSLVQSQQRVRVPVVGPDNEPTEALRLQFQFVASLIDQRLADADIPRFGEERPSLLLWVSIEDQAGIRLADDPILEVRLAEQSRRLGLDVLRPLGDLVDLAEVRVSDVRGGFLDTGEPALQRYEADMVVMLSLRQIDESNWNGRWFWRLEGRDQSINLDADSASVLIERGMEALLSSLARRYAVVPDQLGARRQAVIVAPIRNDIQYAEVLTHLEGLSMVDSVGVHGARGEAIDFELTLSSGGLIDAIELGGVLRVESTLPDGRLALTPAR